MHMARQLVAALAQRCAAQLPDAQLQNAAKQISSFMQTAENQSVLQPVASYGGSECISEFSGSIDHLNQSSSHEVCEQGGCLELAATAHCSVEVSGRRNCAQAILSEFCAGSYDGVWVWVRMCIVCT